MSVRNINFENCSHIYGNQSRCCVMVGGPLMTTRCTPACSQALPGLGQRYWSVSGVTWPPKSGVSEVGVFRALQPNEQPNVQVYINKCKTICQPSRNIQGAGFINHLAYSHSKVDIDATHLWPWSTSQSPLAVYTKDATTGNIPEWLCNILKG